MGSNPGNLWYLSIYMLRLSSLFQLHSYYLKTIAYTQDCSPYRQPKASLSLCNMHLHYSFAALSLISQGSAAAVIKRQTVSTNMTSGWAYQGCYSDSVSSRVLSGSSFVDSTGMTEQVCVAHCAKAGYTFAGVEYGGSYFFANW